MMDGRNRADIRAGIEVEIVLKKDQRTGRLTRGVVKESSISRFITAVPWTVGVGNHGAIPARSMRLRM